jgi:hypothetical protein
MTLTETLQIRERFLKFEDMRALDYVERRWKENGRPTERWKLINFLENMLRELENQEATRRYFCCEKKKFSDARLRSPNPARSCPEIAPVLTAGYVPT